jgi:DNA-binding MarR family transcriptional regulator
MAEPTDTDMLIERRLALTLHRATSLVDRVADVYLRPAHGIGISAFAALVTIDALEPARQSAIAAGLGVSRPAITQRLADLSARGLVEVVDDPTNQRARLVSLSTSGRTLLSQAWDGLSRSQDGLEQGVDLIALQGALDRLIANAEAHLDSLGAA